MKKLLVLCLCLVFFVGCSDASAKISNGNETIVSVGGKKVVKEQLYEVLKHQDSGQTVLRLINNFIVSQEVELTSEIEAEAKAELAKAETDMGEDFQMMLDYYGYESKDAYYEKEVLPAAMLDHLADAYIEEGKDEIVIKVKKEKYNLITKKQLDYIQSLKNVLTLRNGTLYNLNKYVASTIISVATDYSNVNFCVVN